MTSTSADGSAAALPPARWSPVGRGILPLATVLLLVLAYLVAIVVPYLVNDLHRLPLAEVAGGGHDPKDLWPATTPLGPTARLLAIGVLMTGPLLATAAAGWAVADLVAGRRRGHRTLVLPVLTVLLAVAFLVGYFSPVGTGLGTWTMD
jgi:heme/copper-type cytochrome/quinol oxidase subunit 3